MTTPDDICQPGYQLRYTIPNPTSILMCRDRTHIQNTLHGIDCERYWLECGLRHLRYKNFNLKRDSGQGYYPSDELREQMIRGPDARRYTFERMRGMELETLRNICIRMVTSNRALVEQQHRLRDENEALTRELEESETDRMEN
ncbi:MAG: hypothetical protein Q9201_005994 [Fulgogasparrea decipioides]